MNSNPLCLCFALLIGACADDVSGAYENQEATLRYVFSSNDQVFITSLGITVRGTYTVESDQVIVHSPQRVVAFDIAQRCLIQQDGTSLFKTQDMGRK